MIDRPVIAAQAKPTELAEAIVRHKDAIMRRWLELVRGELGERKVDAADLQDGLGTYLDAVAATLARVQAGTTRGEDLAVDGAKAWEAAAVEHASTRVKLGFDIAQLVQEFVILRRVLLQIAREEGLFSGESVEAITELISAAVRSAVQSYVEARDYATQKAEAEHVAFITHELRNPLSTAIIAAGSLKDASGRRDLLLRNLRRMEDLIENVLQTERFQADEVKANAVETTLGRVLSDAVTTGREKAKQKGLSYVESFDPEMPICADPDLTSSAVQNLIENAVKFTDHGEVGIAAERAGDDVVIHVRDTGPGLSPGDLQMMFEPFKRGPSNKPGTGMGLSIARRSIEAQGGALRAESPGSTGSHFWITLPSCRH